MSIKAMKKTGIRIIAAILSYFIFLQFSALPVFAQVPTDNNNREIVNLALNKDKFTISMIGEGSDLDPATGDVSIKDKEPLIVSRLTDGIYASGLILEGKWNGTSGRSKYAEFYRNVNRTITLDLTTTSNINTIRLHAAENAKYGVEAPLSIKYYASTDGADWRPVGKVMKADAKLDKDPEHSKDDTVNYYYEISGLNYNAKYIRMDFDVGVWTFTDELEVLGTVGANPTANPLPPQDSESVEKVYNQYAQPSQSNGIVHEMLIYSGWYDSGKKTSERFVEDLTPFIAYVDNDGKPLEFMFDSLTFLNHNMSSTNKNFVSGDGVSLSQEKAATKADWQEWIDFIFDYTSPTGKKNNLDALDEAAAKVKTTLKKPDHKVGVKIAIYPAIHTQTKWGELNGQNLDFTMSAGSREKAIANRVAACKWYIDQVISRFNSKNYQNIRFDGFYWYDESMHLTQDDMTIETLQQVNQYIKSKTLQSYWIPMFQSPGFRFWETYGFDYAIMQPNYAFNANATENRIGESARLSKKYGLGVEMELGGLREDYIDKFISYLEMGYDLGYQNNSIVGWYVDTWALSHASKNVDNTRYIYDAVFEFFKGNKVTVDKNGSNMALHRPITIKVAEILDNSQHNMVLANLNKLTDGKTAGLTYDRNSENAPYIAVNKGYQKAPIEFMVDLGKDIEVSSVDFSTLEVITSGISSPDKVEYYASSDNITFTKLGEVLRDQARAIDVSNPWETATKRIYTLSLDAKKSVRYVKAVLSYGEHNFLYLDEFTVKGNPPYIPPEIPDDQPIISLEVESVLDQTEHSKALKNLNVLLDGQYAGLSYDRNSLTAPYIGLNKGWQKAPLRFTIDYRENKAIECIETSFMEAIGASIGAPSKVEYFGSTDNITFEKLGQVLRADAVEIEVEAYGETALKCKYTLNLVNKPSVRYVKAVVEYNNDANFIYIDEITMTGKTATDKPIEPEKPNEPTEPVQPNVSIINSSVGNIDALIEGLDGYTFDALTKFIVNNANLETLQKLAKLPKNMKLLEGYEIKLMLNDLVIQLNGKVKITLNLSDSLKNNNNLVVVYINDQGVITEMDTKITKDTISFITNHLSTYAIVEKTDKSSENTIPGTGDNRELTLISIISAAALGTIILKRKKLN